MNIVLPTPAKYTYDSKQFFGALRVDEMTVHNINYTFSAKIGEQVAIFSLINFEKRTTILDELKRGSNARFKLTTDDNEFYLRFSLLGFTAASTRTLELCGQFNSGKTDKEYFEDRLRVKSDKNYFRY